MKKLDRTKAYYLGDLSEHQRGLIYDFLLSEDNSFYSSLKSDFEKVSSDYVFYDEHEWGWYGNDYMVKLLKLDEVNGLTLFESIVDWTPKQGEKVLLRVVDKCIPKLLDKWIPKIFVCNHNGKNLFETAQGNAVFFEGEIKPFIKFFKKGDWVKYKYNGETFFTQCKEDVENNNLTLVEDEGLIELLNKNKSLA